MLERDANNRFFLRGPRFRMTAEMIRDNGLQIAGLLSDKMGGPSHLSTPTGWVMETDWSKRTQIHSRQN
jgi:hypothetical protein